MKIAVITPYHKEPPQTLLRCMESVCAQGMPVDHIMVADGFPQDWIEARPNVRHLALRQNAGDFGDTPRTLGFMLGVRHDYDVLQFLDVDNILEPRHFGIVTDCFSKTGADMIFAKRRMLRPDGSVIDVRLEEDEKLEHVDTSCFVFNRSSFHVGVKWGFIPKALSFNDDRVFLGMVRKSKLKVLVMAEPTVGYNCMWPYVYELAGETPPPGCRDIEPHIEAAKRWWDGLSEQTQSALQQQLGVTVKL